MVRHGLVLLVALGLSFLSLPATSRLAAEEPKTRFFELRIYTTYPGKLEALHKRFREHTNRIFKKHGMQLVGYWTPTEGEEANHTLVYMLAFPSKEAREKAWAAFRKDPEWQKVYQESRKDGPIVKKVQNKFLTPTDYSPIK
jgi:hypothetical protein